MALESDRGNRLNRLEPQELVGSLRSALAQSGAAGIVMGQFLTQFVPEQRMDRLQDFVQRLEERIAGLEQRFAERLESSAAFAALAEGASAASVQTSSSERRRDLAGLLRTGLSRRDAELIEHQALLDLVQQLNDAEMLVLVSYGMSRIEGHVRAFEAKYPDVFNVRPVAAGYEHVTEDGRRWTMYRHYQSRLVSLGLLRDTEGIVKSSYEPRLEITALGRLLLDATERSVRFEELRKRHP